MSFQFGSDLRRGLIGLSLSAGLLASTAAGAVTIVQSPSGTGNNVLFNSCSGANQTPGTTVQGCLNGQPTTLVNFTSNENLVVNGGQARIEAQDGAFTQLQMGYADPTFGTTIVVLNVLTDNADPNGSVEFVIDFFGATPDINPSGAFTVDGNGQNFFTITAGPGELIDTVLIRSTAGITAVIFDDVRQVRLADPTVYTPPPPPPTGVPEPGTLALLGAALAGLGIARRKR